MSNNIFDIGHYVSGVPWENLTEEYQEFIDREEYEDDPWSVPYDAVDTFDEYNDFYYYEDELDEYFNELLPDARSYIVFLFRGTWNGKSGYKVCKTRRECFSFDYDCSLYFKKKYKDEVFTFSLHSHDVPMGANLVVVPVQRKESLYLDTLFDPVEYAKDKLKKIKEDLQ